MLKILLEKELRDILYSTQFAITFAAASILILLSFYVGIRNYQASVREYEAANSADATTISSMTEWRQVQHRVFRAPQPLQVLVNGVTNDIGRTTDMRASGELNLINSRFSVDPMFAVFRFLDLTFVVVIVFTLFGILFGYDAINGEKELGTLKLVFANKVSRASFILSKLIGSLLALGVPLLIPMLIGCVMLLGFGIPMSGGEWMQLVFVMLAGVACFAVFLTLSIMISALVSRSSVSFLLSLVVWIFSILIIPKGSVLLASRIATVPSLDTIESQKRKFTADQMTRRMKDMQTWFTTHMTNDTSFMTIFGAYQDSMNKVYEQARQDFYGRLNEDWQNKKDWQERWAFGLSRISPTAVFQIAAMNLAGTDVEMKYRYLDDLNRYQDTYAKFMQAKTGSSADMFRIVMKRFNPNANQEEEKPKPLNPADIPAFTNDPRPLGASLAAALPDVGLLVVLTAVFFAGAFVSFLKFDLR